jgi:hypothetical protein
MKDAEAHIRRIERASELVALAMSLSYKCDGGCGRFATIQPPDWPALCDECLLLRYPQGGQFMALKQAKRARRFEQLLKGEGI